MSGWTRTVVWMVGIAAAATWPGAGAVEACSSPLTVAAASTSGNSLFATIANPTGTDQSGYFIADVLLDSGPVSVGVPVSVPANSSTGIQVDFASNVTLVGTETCEQLPGGITETPDPVARGKPIGEGGDSKKQE